MEAKYYDDGDLDYNLDQGAYRVAYYDYKKNMLAKETYANVTKFLEIKTNSN